MWAIRSDIATEEVRAILSALERPHPVPLDRYLRQVASDTRPRQTNNLREQVLDGVVAANRPLQRLGVEDLTDLVVDIPRAQAARRGVLELRHACCRIPGYTGGGSSACWTHVRLFALQGIWTRDFVALESWCQSKNQSRSLMDLAGNACITTVCIAVHLGVMVAIS